MKFIAFVTFLSLFKASLIWGMEADLSFSPSSHDVQGLLEHYAALTEEQKNSIQANADLARSSFPAMLDSFDLVAGDQKRILDVGSSSGSATKELCERGFIVDAVEPSRDEVAAGYAYGNYQHARSVSISKLQDLGEELNDTFDHALCSYIFIPQEEHAAFFHRLKHLVKEDGIVYLTINWSSTAFLTEQFFPIEPTLENMAILVNQYFQNSLIEEQGFFTCMNNSFADILCIDLKPGMVTSSFSIEKKLFGIFMLRGRKK